MNASFLIGLAAGIGLVVYGILDSGSDFSQVVNSFINLPSMYITFGGAIAATIMSVPYRYLKELPKSLKVLIKKEDRDLVSYINAIEELAIEARVNGILSLENKIETMEIKDEFLKYCVMMIVDTVEPAKVRQQIETELEQIEGRHSEPWQVFDTLADFGPSFGMLGTLIGLINMLANMEASDSGALGRGMSVALVTTFYGSFLASMIAQPISSRLKGIHDEEMIVKELIMEGVLAIQDGENPDYIKEKLTSRISYSER